MENTINKKSGQILQTEIKKIKDLETLAETKTFIENELKTREKVITLCNEANSFKTNKSFSFIKESMEHMSPVLFNSKAGRNLITKYVNEVKSNATLSSLHALLEGLRKINNADMVQSLIKEWSEKNTFNKKEYNKGIKKLGDILSEGYILSELPYSDFMNEEKNAYHSAVMTVVENHFSNKRDYAEYFNNINVIAEQVAKGDNSDKLKNEELIQRFNKVVTETLAKREEQKIKEEIFSGNEKDIYEEEKQKCITSLKEAKEKLEKEGDFESGGRIELFIENVEKKTFKAETITEDVLNFRELSKCFL